MAVIAELNETLRASARAGGAAVPEIADTFSGHGPAAFWDALDHAPGATGSRSA